MPQQKTTDLILKRLHPSRVETYARYAKGDNEKALQLYLWNLQLGSAFHSSLSIFEVVLRNAIDEKLREWNANQINLLGQYHSPDWLKDPAKPLNSLTKNARDQATQHAAKARTARASDHPRKDEDISHDDILAQLSFGAFVRLLPAFDETEKTYRARHVLWEESLSSIFISDTEELKLIQVDRISRIHSLRNRVAHLEPLLGVNVRARHRDMIRVIGALEPEIQGWFSGVSNVMEVNTKRP